MKLSLELQATAGGECIKYDVIGSVLPDQSFDGNVLYQIDSSPDTKYWIGKDLRSCGDTELIRGLVNKKGEIIKLGLHKAT